MSIISKRLFFKKYLQFKILSKLLKVIPTSVTTIWSISTMLWVKWTRKSFFANSMNSSDLRIPPNWNFPSKMSLWTISSSNYPHIRTLSSKIENICNRLRNGSIKVWVISRTPVCYWKMVSNLKICYGRFQRQKVTWQNIEADWSLNIVHWRYQLKLSNKINLITWIWLVQCSIT